MELKINLATASLKDAEHAIFIIGAYFGMTSLPTVGVNGGLGAPLAPVAQTVAATVHGTTDPYPTVDLGPLVAQAKAEAQDPAAVFGTPQPSAAEVFGGNVAPVAPAQVGTIPSPATVAPSVTPAAGPAVGDAGNVAPGATVPGSMPSPATTGPVAGASVAGVEVDADGLPWDARIHAAGDKGAKPKNADGRWRKKRGLNDAAFVALVQNELRATMAAPAPTAPTPPAPPAATAPTPPTPPVVAPQQPAAVDPQTFEQIMPRFTAASAAGHVPQGALLEACTAYGLPNIPALAQRPDMVPHVWLYLKSQYPALA